MSLSIWGLLLASRPKAPPSSCYRCGVVRYVLPIKKSSFLCILFTLTPQETRILRAFQVSCYPKYARRKWAPKIQLFLDSRRRLSNLIQSSHLLNNRSPFYNKCIVIQFIWWIAHWTSHHSKNTCIYGCLIWWISHSISHHTKKNTRILRFLDIMDFK